MQAHWLPDDVGVIACSAVDNDGAVRNVDVVVGASGSSARVLEDELRSQAYVPRKSSHSRAPFNAINGSSPGSSTGFSTRPSNSSKDRQSIVVAD